MGKRKVRLEGPRYSGHFANALLPLDKSTDLGKSLTYKK